MSPEERAKVIAWLRWMRSDAKRCSRADIDPSQAVQYHARAETFLVVEGFINRLDRYKGVLPKRRS